MKIKESGDYFSFDLVEDADGHYAFEYEKNNIGFDREQAKQIIEALTHAVETGGLPE